MSGEEVQELSHAQRARAERNRQKALLLRQARLTAQPYSRSDQGLSLDRVVRLHNTKLVDTGAGFFLEEKDLNEEPEEPKVFHLCTLCIPQSNEYMDVEIYF